MSWISDQFDHLWQRLKNIPPSVSHALEKLETDAGALAKELSAIAAKDIIQGGVINTASYVAAAKDIAAKVMADGSTIILPDIFFILNAEVSYLLGNTDTSNASQEQPPVS